MSSFQIMYPGISQVLKASFINAYFGNMVELFNNLFGAYEEQNTNRMSVLSKSDCSFTGINNRLMGLLF